MITTNIYEKSVEEIFIRKPTKKEKQGGSMRSRGFLTIPIKEGYEVVYKPYGLQGVGYYYSKEITE